MPSKGAWRIDRDKFTKTYIADAQGNNFNKTTENMTKSEKLMNGVGVWTAYWRKRPDKFAEDVYGIKLKNFQKFLLCLMMRDVYTMFLASRGLGKTFLTALYCIIRCILYPGTKIVVAAGQKSQSMKIVTEKIPEIIEGRPLLKREIEAIRTGLNEDRPNVSFRNGSWIKVVAATDGARSARANILILDEFRMIDENVYRAVLRPFLAVNRQPGYRSKPEYANYPLERNQEIFLSSCYFKSNWAYDRYKVFRNAMKQGKGYGVYVFPYQMAVKSGLKDKRQVIDELQEEDFDPILWQMEQDAIFYGQAANAWFDYEKIDKVRNVNYPIYPINYYDLMKDKKFIQPEKKSVSIDGKLMHEIRVLCVDIATMAGKINDASAYILLSLIPDARGYLRKVSYLENMEGGHTVLQTLRIRQLYEELNCDYIVLDREHAGIAIYDNLSVPFYDKETGKEYPPMVSMNEEDIRARCEYDDALEVIYTVHGTEVFNDEIARNLRDMIMRRRLQMLGDNEDMITYLNQFPEYITSSPETKALLESPYIETRLLINEMILLEGEFSEKGTLKLKTIGRNRKDRYSALAYGNYFAKVLEDEALKPMRSGTLADDIIALNRPVGNKARNSLLHKIFR